MCADGMGAWTVWVQWWGKGMGMGSIIKYINTVEYYSGVFFLVIAHRNIWKSKQNYSNTLNGHDIVFLCFYSINIRKHKKTLYNRGTFYWA
jgi:hypothetical protein